MNILLIYLPGRVFLFEQTFGTISRSLDLLANIVPTRLNWWSYVLNCIIAVYLYEIGWQKMCIYQHEYQRPDGSNCSKGHLVVGFQQSNEQKYTCICHTKVQGGVCVRKILYKTIPCYFGVCIFWNPTSKMLISLAITLNQLKIVIKRNHNWGPYHGEHTFKIPENRNLANQ